MKYSFHLHLAGTAPLNTYTQFLVTAMIAPLKDVRIPTFCRLFLSLRWINYTRCWFLVGQWVGFILLLGCQKKKKTQGKKNFDVETFSIFHTDINLKIWGFLFIGGQKLNKVDLRWLLLFSIFLCVSVSLLYRVFTSTHTDTETTTITPNHPCIPYTRKFST